MNYLPHVTVLEFAYIVAGICSGIAALYSIKKDNRGVAVVLGGCFLASVAAYALQHRDRSISIDFSGPDQVVRGTVARIHWSVTPDGAVVALEGDRVSPSGEREVRPIKETIYTLIASLPDGKREQKAWTVHVLPVPIEISFSADRTAVRSGEIVKINWQVTGDATSAAIMPDIGAIELQGERTIEVKSSASLTLTASGPAGSVSREIAFRTRETEVDFNIEPASIRLGERAVLRWRTNADSVTIQAPGSDEIAAGPAEGSRDVNPEKTTVYTLKATGPGGETTVERTLTVSLAPTPTVRAWARPDRIPLGQSTQIGWTSQDAVSVRIQGQDFNGNFEASGNRTIRPSGIGSFRYTISASGPGGNATDSIVLDVTPALAVQVPAARRTRLAILGLERGPGIQNPFGVDQIIAERLTQFFRDKYDLVAANTNRLSIQNYISSVRQSHDSDVPDLISYATVSAESNRKERDYIVAQALKVEMAAHVTLRVLRVNDNGIVSVATGFGKKSATIAWQAPVGAGNSTPQLQKLEVDAVNVALTDALNHFQLGKSR